jgi:hypothetical protein
MGGRRREIGDGRKETGGKRWEKGNVWGRKREKEDGIRGSRRGEELIKGEGTRYRFRKGEMEVKTRNRREEI